MKFSFVEGMQKVLSLGIDPSQAERVVVEMEPLAMEVHTRASTDWRGRRRNMHTFVDKFYKLDKHCSKRVVG